MGKNCYEKEKLSLIFISDKSNIVFFNKYFFKKSIKVDYYLN